MPHKKLLVPKLILFGPKDFIEIKNALEKLGFTSVSRYAMRRVFTRLDLHPPKKNVKGGSEVGFIYKPVESSNNYSVYVWTSYVPDLGHARPEDFGWVLITDGDKALYFAHPLIRTMGFKKKLLSYAWISMYKVLHRPVCPECGAWMHITPSKGISSRRWCCKAVKAHKSHKWITLPWDFGLGPKAIAFLEKERKFQRKYRAKRRKNGQPTDVAITNRQRWEIRKPENAITSGPIREFNF